MNPTRTTDVQNSTITYQRNHLSNIQWVKRCCAELKQMKRKKRLVDLNDLKRRVDQRKMKKYAFVKLLDADEKKIENILSNK